ncbi:MAG: GAF domain-containing protein [Planctomycetota bacterium]|nr:GAF domain-containing protein [Planctomycetota bacterium]
MFRDLLKKHPVLRYGALLACLLAAGVTVWISYLANPSSAPWLAALYLTVGVLLSTLRRVGEPGLYRSFALYQLCVLAYLWIVWTVYVTPPGPDPAATAEALYFLFRWFGIGGCYVAAGLLHFTIRFARAEGRIWSWIEGGVWLAAAGFHVLQSCGLISEAMIYAGNKWVPSFSAYYPYFFGYISFVLTLALGLPVAKAVTARSRALRLQMFYFIVGALPVWVSCWTHFLMSMGFRLPGLGGIMYLAHVAILGYAVLVRRVYDVSVVIRRGLAYATISVLMGLLYAGLMAASWRWLGAQELFHGILATTAFLALAGLLYAPLLHLMQGWVDRVFFRARADREALLAEHAQQMASTLSLDEVMRRMADLLRRGLDARRVILFLVASSGAPEAYGVQGESFSAAREMSDDSGMADWRRWLARERPTECRVVSGERDAAPEAGLRMTEGREYLAVPVRHRDATLAWAILEPKRADEPYEPDELLFARTVAGNVSVALQNARRYAQIEQLQRLARQTIAGLSAGVLLLREDGSILLDNPAARKLLSASDPPPPRSPITPATARSRARSFSRRSATARPGKTCRSIGRRPNRALCSGASAASPTTPRKARCICS